MDIVEELSRGIAAWIAESANRTNGTLQKRSGVAETTIRRIRDRESKTVSLENALELAHVLFDTDDAIAFIKRHFPVAGRWQEKFYSKKDDVVTYGEHLQDPVSFKIILLCDTLSGASTEEIKEELGADGLRQLSKLVELGFIAHSNGTHKCTHEGLTLFASHHVHFAILQNMIKFYNPENANIKAACAEFVCYQGLNRAGVENIAAKIRELEEIVAQISQDPNFRGDIPWFIGLVQNVLRGNLL